MAIARLARRSGLYLTLCTLLLGLRPAISQACGLPLAAQIHFERALLIANGSQQQLITTVDLSETDGNAAVIFAVPAPARVDQPTNGADLFSYLTTATQPEVEHKNRYVWRLSESDTAAGSPGSGVDLLSQQVLGDYEVASLAGADAQALWRWLDEHHYDLPAAAEPILAAYVSEGWTFVAVRLAEAAATGTLAPLRISYTSERLVYPMRLGALSDQPIGLDLFVLSEHRSEVVGLETTFAGPLSSLDPAPVGEVAGTLNAASYLTRMQASDLDPASLASDFSIGQASSDEPYRKAITIYDTVSFAERYGVLSVLLCIAAFSPISFVIALSIRRRIEALVPRPEKE